MDSKEIEHPGQSRQAEAANHHRDDTGRARGSEILAKKLMLGSEDL